jgi:hypothetical protein
MAKSDQPNPGQPKPTATFGDLTKEIARRNDEAQRAARVKRDAREREQIARRREWERL